MQRRAANRLIAKLSAEALRCRDARHRWDPYTARRTRIGFDRTFRCGTCHTMRHEVLDKLGRVLSRSYTYPEDYLVSGSGRPSTEFNDAVRLASTLAMTRENSA